MILILFLGFFHRTSAQEVYFNTGKNYSRFTYSNKEVSSNYLINNSNLLSDSGNSYELGILFESPRSKIGYAFGLTYNEFNSTYAIDKTNIKYSWQTKYIGIAPQLHFILYQFNENDMSNWNKGSFRINCKVGINAASFVYGYENADGLNYSLTSNPDYKKIIINPFVGVDLSYPITDLSTLSLGYTLSTARVAMDQGNQFNILNNNLHLGLNIKLFK